MTLEDKKEAKRLYDIEYRRKNKIRIAKLKKDWYEKNPDIVRASKIRNVINKKISDKKYAQKNKEKLNEKKMKWAKANPDKVRKSNNNWQKEKMKNDQLFKLKRYLTSSIKYLLKSKNYIKKSKTTEILGCSFEDFKLHLESKFEPWMNWDNYGNPKDGIFEINKTWDIDHINPVSSANSEYELLKMNHYSNLQPLCSYKNRWIKKNKVNVVF